MLDVLKKSVLGGFMIGIGGIVYLSCDNKYIGALLFALGLFTILVFGFKLFTGAVGYFPDKNLPLIWIGNLIGTFIAGKAVLFTRYASLSEKALKLSELKLSDSPVSIFILACFCGALMFIAVDAYKSKGMIIATFLAVPTFILCGFEHCIANMVYFTIASAWSFKAVLYMAIMTAGNAVGAIIFNYMTKQKARGK